MRRQTNAGHTNQDSIESKTSRSEPQSVAPFSPQQVLQRAQNTSASLTRSDINNLQRTIGNRATGRLLSQRLSVQTKLQVGPANDKYEEEADRMAQQVMRTVAAPAPPVQREEDEGASVVGSSRYASSIANLHRRSDLPSPSRLFTKPKIQREEMDEERVQTKPNDGLARAVEIASFSSGSPVIQRTIDQDARFWAMDWLATWTRPFPQAAKKYALPKLLTICTGVMGEENPLGPAPPVTQVARATHTTALAAGLVKMGEEKAGQLSARLADNKNGLFELMQELEGEIPDQIPALKLATVQTDLDYQALNFKDPFLVLRSGGAQFTFSRQMAKHMMRRHHPRYLSGQPMQVQSYFDEDTTIKEIEAIITGTVNQSENEIKEWRKYRADKKTDLNSAKATTLNLRPFWDGRHWELTLTLGNTNRQDAKGEVAHFTPTL